MVSYYSTPSLTPPAMPALPPPTPTPADDRALATVAPVAHDENFPVASCLCPRALRAPIAAIYHYARTADDLADEGDAPFAQRLTDLAAYRTDLLAVARNAPPSARWAAVYAPLAAAMRRHALPVPLLLALLDAFEQDVRLTAAGTRYARDADLLDYCTRSANPIGRLLLHLYGVSDAASLAQSDAICTALQLINFWQDVSVDQARGRCYLTDEALHRHGAPPPPWRADSDNPAMRALIRHAALDARARMLAGAPLVHRLSGRMGWELRLVVQGGLRVLDHIAALNWATWRQRPRLSRWDGPRLLWRAMLM